MAQHDQVIDNGPGLVVRQDINSALAALFSTSSGPVEPQVAVAGQLWLDTSVTPNGQLKQRNLTNNGWVAPNITLGTADLWFGTRLAPDRFIWNDQANGAGNDIMTLTERGVLNMGLPGGSAGLTGSVGITTKVDDVNGDYLAINNARDGTGADTIKLRNNGNAEFGANVSLRGTSAQVQIKPTSGNGHVWFFAADGVTTRAIIYTSSGAQGHLLVQLNGQTFQFGLDGNFYVGGSYHATNGNIIGSLWSNWGAADAYSAISARIESRAQAWANSVAGNCVQAMRSANYTEYNHTSGTAGTRVTFSGYYVVMTLRITGDQYAFGFRQIQHYIPNVGWVQSTAW